MNTLQISPQEIFAFQTFILRYYQKHGRHELPWRQTDDPYCILVSELMLQQTQVTRVLPKYQAFLAVFPTIPSLALAPLSQVLSLWQGLGYNRRAKFLWELAGQLVSETQQQLISSQKITKDSKNPVCFPKTEVQLQQLPGIGPYTASAIMTFAYNQPTIVIETNIRTVFLYHFFPEQSKVSDSQLLPLISQTLHTQNPKEWYWALMDYGAHLKKILPNPSRKSKHHTKQSIFKGSLRQVRGEIIRLLVQQQSSQKTNSGLTKTELQQKVTGNKLHFEEALTQLHKEKLIIKQRTKGIELITLPTTSSQY